MIWPSLENRMQQFEEDLRMRNKTIFMFIETVKDTIPETILNGYREEYKQIIKTIKTIQKLRKELGG